MTFTPNQIAELQRPLDPANVKPPAPGKYGEYVDGFHVLSEANRIFGHDGWGYSITGLEMCSRVETADKNGNPQIRVGYRCTVRATVAGVVREGAAVGTGMARPENEADAHESAVKEAETDALKRALRSFGYTFGLALYDKSKANVQTPPVALFTDEQRDEIKAMAEGAGITLQAILNNFNKNTNGNARSLKDLPQTEYGPIRNVLQERMEKRAEQQKETT